MTLEKLTRGVQVTKRGVYVSNALLLAGILWLYGELRFLRAHACQCHGSVTTDLAVSK